MNWFRVDMLPADMGGQQLIWLGQAYPFESQYLQWIPFTFYGGVILVAILSATLGRVFCGWTCPHNIMTEWTRWIRALSPVVIGKEVLPLGVKRWINKSEQRKRLMQILAPVVALVWCVAMTFLLFSYVIPPGFIVESFTTGHVHIALGLGVALFTLIGLFLLYVGHNFCRICCPYGLAQSLPLQTGKLKPLAIVFSGEQSTDCGGCKGCETACPVDIDPRKPENLIVGNFDGCFNCGECIDACGFIRSTRDNGLLRFR